jgi:flagellar hook protein FlgE
MPGSFSIALTGLNADKVALDVVGNNLANLNTTGFKESSVSFHDLVSSLSGSSSSQVGAGVSAPDTQRQFLQGSIQLTGGAFDAAIQGSGFFVAKDSGGRTLYTRAGNFQLDANGNLVTATGEKVQGWSATAGVLDTTGGIGNIVIPQNSLQTPSATTQFTMNLNLNAAGVVGDTTGTFSAPIQVVDSLGATHTVTVTFTKTAANAWKYVVTVPGEELTGGTAGTPSSVANGNITFDSSGQLKTPAAGSPIDVKIPGLVDGAKDLDISWNLYNAAGSSLLTQFANPSALSASSQDGIAAAQVTQVAVGDGGQIIAHFSDGTQQVVAQLALAAVSNPDSLVAIGNNNFEVGTDTATPAVGTAGTGGRGTIQAGALEASTVDIAQEFTNLIVYQRSYQANSRVITTLDEITQDLLALKR